MSGPTYPRCCGSEDGEVLVGVDPSTSMSTVVVTIWHCNTCGVFTVVKDEEVKA